MLPFHLLLTVSLKLLSLMAFVRKDLLASVRPCLPASLRLLSQSSPCGGLSRLLPLFLAARFACTSPFKKVPWSSRCASSEQTREVTEVREKERETVRKVDKEKGKRERIVKEDSADRGKRKTRLPSSFSLFLTLFPQYASNFFPDEGQNASSLPLTEPLSLTNRQSLFSPFPLLFSSFHQLSKTPSLQSSSEKKREGEGR